MRLASLARRKATLLTAASLLAACGDQDVSGPAASEFEVGIVAMVEAPSVTDWPSGNVLRVSVTRNGASVGGAVVSAGQARMEERGDYYEPATPPDFAMDSLIAIEVRLPGFTRRDTLAAPTPSRIVAPMPGADLRGCSFFALEWRVLPDADSAWILVEGDGGATLTVAASQGSATISAPTFAQPAARVRVLSLERASAFRPDRAFPAIIPSGVHRLAWSAPIDINLDPRSPLEVATPESLFVAFEVDDSVRIVWSPDTARVHRLTVSTQFYAEGNLRWQIVSDDGFLPPVVFGALPAGSRACAPAGGVPGPIQPGVEYFVEVIGKRHSGSVRGIPLAGTKK